VLLYRLPVGERATVRSKEAAIHGRVQHFFFFEKVGPFQNHDHLQASGDYDRKEGKMLNATRSYKKATKKATKSYKMLHTSYNKLQHTLK